MRDVGERRDSLFTVSSAGWQAGGSVGGVTSRLRPSRSIQCNRLRWPGYALAPGYPHQNTIESQKYVYAKYKFKRVEEQKEIGFRVLS
jgi:hypothetical protein